jgi:L-malate glycosyltransferase
LKIIIGIPCLLKGGTEFQTLQLVRALVQLQNHVMVVCYFEYEQEMVALFEKEGAKIELLNYSRQMGTFKFISAFASYLKKAKPTVVHVQYMAPGALPIISAVLARVPRIIATVHQPFTSSHGWKSKLILKISARWCRPFLSVSQNAARSWFGKATLIDSQKSINQQPKQLTLYNSIDVERIEKIANQFQYRNDLNFHNINSETFVIGAVSRMRIEKGIDLLITAFAELLPKAERDLRLLLVGDGPERKELEALAIKLNCQENIVFYGSAEWEEAMQLMARMDLVVVPSRFEGFGLSAAEAMAMSKPLICSNAFGLKELVCHNRNGLLFQNGDAKQLFIQLNELINSPKKAKRFGEQAFLKTKQYFDYPLFVSSIRILYQL